MATRTPQQQQWLDYCTAYRSFLLSFVHFEN